MEDQTRDCDNPENISDALICCVCLDLVYKPVVLSCGHISCFWCTYSSMNSSGISRCPICRHPYYHFPSVCIMLHTVLSKVYPMTYKIIEIQTLEKEEKTEMFSPQFDFHPYVQSLNQKANEQLTTSSQPDFCLDPIDKDKSQADDDATNSSENIEIIKAKRILIADVLCVACNKMLIRPVVFNCGHVCCETCIIIPTAMEELRCRVCQSTHRSGPLRVCLELDHLLEYEFPEEYYLRKATLQNNQVCSLPEISNSCSTEASKIDVPWSSFIVEAYDQLCKDHGSNVHFQIMCDFCGMYPIIGDRYKCKDCVEKAGFDLCSECYNARFELPGRFNQQHTLNHQFELTEPYNSMVIFNPNNDHVDSSFSDDALQNLQIDSLLLPSIVDDDILVRVMISDTNDDNDDDNGRLIM